MVTYRAEDIPDSFHYKNSRLVLPILLVANVGYKIEVKVLLEELLF